LIVQDSLLLHPPSSAGNPSRLARETSVDLQEEAAQTILENPSKFSYSTAACPHTLIPGLFKCFSPTNISRGVPRKWEL